MSKLFITLYFVVLASFALFIGLMISLDKIEEILPDADTQEKRMMNGSFMLLDQSLEGLNTEQQQAMVLQHKKAFDFFFDCVPLSQLALNDDEIAQLKKGDIVATDTENDLLKNSYQKSDIHKTNNAQALDLDLYYKKIPNMNKVWRLNFDVEVSHNLHNFTARTQVTAKAFTRGMHSLIHALLLTKAEDQWPSLLEALQVDYPLPLRLYETSTLLAMIDQSIEHQKEFSFPIEQDDSVMIALAKEDELATRIHQGEVVNITQGSHYATFIQRIPHSTKILQIGAIKIPWLTLYALQIALLSFVLSIATALFLWVRPFWANLLNIKQAADAFGSGDYSARIVYKKRSPIAEVAQAFNSMAKQTQRSIRSHQELTSAVSHELRTPVARMRFALEMLSASHDKGDQQRFVNDINKDIDELDVLLEELLTYARFDQKERAIKREEVPMQLWFSDSMEKLIPLAAGIAQITLRYQIVAIDHNETAWIEPRLMSRVLDNLVQNAFRYAQQQVKVTLTKENQHYLLIVEDDGTGIPEAEKIHIFDAFSRLDASRDRASGGFGLGLAIANRIVKEHQGCITIVDSALGGAQFEVRWPMEMITESLEKKTRFY